MCLLNHAQLINKKIDKDLFFARLHPFTAEEMIIKYDKGRTLKEVIFNT